MRNYTKEEIEKVISESPDMITALEAVGAMYGIPPSHIMGQPGLKSIRVENDMILAPTNVKPNTKAIVCSIGAVLDQISQRINDKLDNFQTNNIRTGQLEDKVAAMANPSKGKVLSHHTATDGSEIIIYDTGLVDYPKTPAARAKVEELRALGMIPNVTVFNDTKYVKPSYFTTEDDIALDDKTDKQLSSNDPTPTDISDKLGENNTHVEMCAHYNDTDHLGYQVFSEMGFDFIRKTDSFVTEAAKAKSVVKSKDINYMKFDNKEITEAIRCFNEARGEQPKAGKGEFSIQQFIESPKYNEGVKHLEKQFDCHLSIYWVRPEEHPDVNSAMSEVVPEMYIKKLTISKSKGFQLSGMPIQIYIVNKAIDESMTTSTNIKLFGQFMCALLCHEIFHNIVNAIRINNSMFMFTLESAMTKAAMTDDPEKKKIIFDRYARTITKTDKGIVSAIERKKLVESLCKMSQLAENKAALNKLQNGLKDNASTTDQVDQLLKDYEDSVAITKQYHNKMIERGKKYQKNNKTSTRVVGILLTCTIIGAPIGITMLGSVGKKNKIGYEYMKQFENYLKTTNKEEYYCDLFASMYNLPPTFTTGSKVRSLTANMMDTDQVKRIAEMEGWLHNFFQTNYPTESERNYSAYIVAKNVLKNPKGIPKEYVDYCQWIVDNYSNIDKSGIDKNYRKHAFNPDESKDLNKHVQNVIDKNKITLTESAS